MCDEENIRTAVQDFLLMLDEYPNQIVPINRNSAAVRLLRQVMGDGGLKCANCGGLKMKWVPAGEGYRMKPCQYCSGDPDNTVGGYK